MTKLVVTDKLEEEGRVDIEWEKQESFVLHGRVPSKKNSKMLTRGRLITKPSYQNELAALTLEARVLWKDTHLKPFTDVKIRAIFHLFHRRQDLDNALNGLMDVLKDAGIIVDDSVMHVKHIEATYKPARKGQEFVLVTLSGYEFNPEKKGGKSRV